MGGFKPLLGAFARTFLIRERGIWESSNHPQGGDHLWGKTGGGSLKQAVREKNSATQFGGKKPPK